MGEGIGLGKAVGGIAVQGPQEYKMTMPLANKEAWDGLFGEGYFDTYIARKQANATALRVEAPEGATWNMTWPFPPPASKAREVAVIEPMNDKERPIVFED